MLLLAALLAVVGPAARVDADPLPDGAAAPPGGAPVGNLGRAVAFPTFTQSWTRTTPGRAVSTSSPVLVANGGRPFVAAADNAGGVRAYDLSTGTPVPGWSSVSVGFGVRAPLSSDGSSVYVPVATDGLAATPQYRRFAADGRPVWSSNPSTVLPTSPTYGFLLSGLTLATVDGRLRGFGGSSGQWVHAVDGATGAERWKLFNADSTMATPAVADVFGTGRLQVVTSNDTSPAFAGDRAGGIFRVLTADGAQVCSATQFVDGLTYAASGYNNSSPRLGVVDGRPLAVFGSTGPVQTGTGGNQVVAYDMDCTLRWASPALAGRTETTPSLVDVTGTGALDAVVLLAVRDGSWTYPRVVVLDGSTGSVVADSGARYRAYAAPLAYPPSMAVATADVDADGDQDLFVPARQGSLLVVDGRTLEVRGTVATNLVVQNTPIVTAVPGGVRLTLAGYSGSGAVVSSYVATGAVLGTGGWHSFGGNPQLTGVQGDVTGPHDGMLEGQVLAPGRSLRRGAARLVMQTDGNLVAYAPDGRARWSTGTRVPGSSARLGLDGTLVVRSPGGTVLWQGAGRGTGQDRLSLADDGTVRVVTTRQTTYPRNLSASLVVWSSSTDRLVRGGTLVSGRNLPSFDGGTDLVLQRDGNLVLLRRRRVVWTSGTRDPTGAPVLRLQSDGNLVLWSGDGRVLKNFATGGRGAVRTVVADDGVLRVQTAGGTTLWASGAPVK